MLTFFTSENIKSVRIGDVVIDIETPNAPELVPEYDEPVYEDSQEVLRHLRWYVTF
jgi:hypothetical protein